MKYTERTISGIELLNLIAKEEQPPVITSSKGVEYIWDKSIRTYRHGNFCMAVETLAIRSFSIEAPILDKTETLYISRVVRPFIKHRNNIRVVKWGSNQYEQYIEIYVGLQKISFPSFPRNTMYAGMTEGWKYTLEELGI